MGNCKSLPEKVFLAVERNDIMGFQALLADFSASSANNPAARTSVLEYKDKSGRTPLLLAAAKNHYQILQQLIHLGADIHYINPTRDAAGAALHEAAARRHEAAVELLLAAGACPFAANAAGRTALDEAVLSGHTGVVRAIEKYAEFSGLINFKTRSMGGLTSKYKTRWAVLMPYYPFIREREGSVNTAAPGHGSSGGGAAADSRKPRRCLWLYKDKTSVSPRCRLWVDGAVVLTAGPAGTEGTLRLHTSHGEPMGDLHITHSHGYCVSFRPADLTPGAASVYHRLLTLLNGGSSPPSAGQQQQQPSQPSMTAPASPALVAPSHGHGLAPNVAYPAPPQTPPPPQPPGTVPPPPFYPAVQPVVAYGSAAPGAGAAYIMVPPPTIPLPGPMPVPAVGLPPVVMPYSGQSQVYPGASGPCPMASPLSLYQPRPSQSSVASGPQMQPGSARASGDPAPMASPTGLASPQRVQRVGDRPSCGPAGDAGGPGINLGFIEFMAALPGESDEAFAARLASAISATSGHSQQALLPQSGTSASGPSAASMAASATTAAASAPQQPPSGGTGSAGTSAGGQGASQPHPADVSLINFHSDPGNGPGPGGVVAPTAGQRPGRPAGGPLDDLDMDAVNALIAATGSEARPPGAGAEAAGASTSSGDAAAPPLPPQPPSPCGLAMPADTEPSAPPAEPFPVSPVRPAAPPPPPPPPEPEQDCIICLNAPKEVGFLHGDSVHRCVCRECSVRIAVGSPCPLCRQPVERVLGVY